MPSIKSDVFNDQPFISINLGAQPPKRAACPSYFMWENPQSLSKEKKIINKRNKKKTKEAAIKYVCEWLSLAENYIELTSIIHGWQIT